MNGPYSSLIQKPLLPRTTASGSRETLTPPGPASPNPLPVKLLAGRFGKLEKGSEVVGSSPASGLPEGSVKRIESR